MLSSEIVESLNGAKTLVTGGTGLIGRQVVDLLLNAGATVKIASIDHHEIDKRAEHIFADLRDFKTCQEIVDGMDYVFHVAGIKGSVKVTIEKPASFFVNLLMMNTNILEACRMANTRKVVYTSSIGAYPSAEVFSESDSQEGPPMDMYPGMAKRIAEQQIMAYKVQYGMNNFAIVRPSNIFGIGDGFDPENAMVIPSLIYKVYHKVENPIRIWGDGSAVRDFLYSRDCAEGIIRALYYGTDSTFINLGSGTGYTIAELVKTLSEVVEFEYEFDATKSSGFPRRVMKAELAKEKLGWEPCTSLKQGLQETWDWYCKNTEEYKLRQNYFVDKV